VTKEELIRFELDVAEAFKATLIRGPIHLAGGNEDKLIEIFKEVKPDDWVLSTWRSHYHALLKGVPRKLVWEEILAGRSMSLHFPQYRFLTSAIVAGIAPIACGLAAAGETVWCFVGDMAAHTGAFFEAVQYATGHDLKVRFIVEDNGFSTNTPTQESWGTKENKKMDGYKYDRTLPHCGIGTYVSF
jgi:TPP-dependent pyruvate/acetoin dehydrogenase alpha subunit